MAKRDPYSGTLSVDYPRFGRITINVSPFGIDINIRGYETSESRIVVLVDKG